MPASFLIIGGELVKDAILHLVEVSQEINQHWWCRVECRQTEDRRVPVEDILGQDLQIVTRDQSGAEHVVFDGFVLEASLVYEVFGSYTARLRAVTRSYKLDLTAQEAYYRKQTLSGVARKLCGADGLTAEVLAADGVKRNYVQWGEPDFRFLTRIADDHNAWIRPTGQGVQICGAFQKGAQVMWRQEDGLLAFDVEGSLAPPAFDGTHADARQMRSVTHTAVTKPAEGFGASGPMMAAAEKQSKAKLAGGAAVLDARAATAEEYKSLLERESLRAATNRVMGHGVSQKEDLKAGDTLEIAGVLDAKGTYGLTKVVHRWTQRGYENEFWCTAASNWLPPHPPEPPAITGVATGRVVDQNDPRKMGRIQVQYDWQEDGPTAWVRATTPHAGQDRGFHFLPEVGDEVVVAFEHGDPERPYVVGSLWNGVDLAPREEFWGADVDPNDVKRIVTKSGHRIQFVDTPGKESIVIATPQHLKISLIEKTDETGRSMILLHSDGDIFLNAPGGRVHLHSASLSQEVGGGGGASAHTSSAAASKASPPPLAPKPAAFAAPRSTAAEASLIPAPSTPRATPSGVNPLSLGDAGFVLKRQVSHIVDPLLHGAPEKYSQGVSIGGSPEYRKAVRAQLDELAKTESGRDVLRRLDRQGNGGKGVVIRPAKGDPDTMADDSLASEPSAASIDVITGKVNIEKPGAGSSSQVDFDPEWQCLYPDGTPCLKPSGALLHELVHATHNADGVNLTAFPLPDPSGGESNHEEAQTMGSYPYDESGPHGAGLDTALQTTENTYRREVGLPDRYSHNGLKSLCPDRPATAPSSKGVA
jgi:type VI secretion system secreted protein VgrG